MMSACQKNGKLTTAGTAGAVAQKSVTDDAENPANPYDYIGLAHNECLQGTRNVWTAKNSTFHDVYVAALNFVRTNYDPHVVVASEQEAQADYNAIHADQANLGANYIAAGSLPAHAQSYSNQIMQLVAKPSAQATYLDIKNNLVSLENQIANDPALSQTDQESLFITASVARYSTLYWLNESTGANNGGSLLRTCSSSGTVLQPLRGPWGSGPYHDKTCTEPRTTRPGSPFSIMMTTSVASDWSGHDVLW